MSIEQKINQKLNNYPGIKKGIKRIYQRTMYTISPKIKSEGKIVRVSPDDQKHEYFFGYYDKCPEDATGRYVLCLKADDTWSDAAPATAAEILLIDTSKPGNDSDRVKVIASTRTWNVQQGCMMQWLGPEFDHEIIYNDFRDGKFCSVILDVFSGAERVLAAPVYSVSADGSFALTLDFARLHRLRPGYGYSNILEETRNEKLPDAPAIWKLDIRTNTATPLLTYADFASFEPRSEMTGAEHKVNHIMLSPSGKRFMVLHRWFDGQRKYTRLVTANTDGSGMYNLSDDDMVSHCCWKDDQTIIAFENKKGQGAGYYLMHDKTQRFERLWPEMTADGHPSCSPDGQLVVADTYPDRARMASVKVMRGNQVETLAKVFAPFKYDNDTRCDLHPRWSRDGKKIYFDSVFEGYRGLYTVNAPSNMGDITEGQKENTQHLLSVIVPVYNVEQYLERCVASIINQYYKHIEVILVDDGSPDRSPEICDRLAKQDDRIKVVHQANGGLSSARNTGLKTASGDLVTFVDSDDWIANDIYRKCIEIIDATGCDVVDFKPVITFSEEDAKKKRQNLDAQKNGEISVVEGEAVLYDYLYRAQMEQTPFSVCRKVYRRGLFDGIEFPVGKINEDIATNFKVLKNAKRLVHIPDIGYFYFRGNETSITSAYLRKKDLDLLNACEELIKLSEKCDDTRIKELAEVKMARSYFSLLARAATKGVADDVSASDLRFLTKSLRKNYKKLMKSSMPINRKLFATAASIDYRMIAIPYGALKAVLRLRRKVTG